MEVGIENFTTFSSGNKFHGEVKTMLHHINIWYFAAPIALVLMYVVGRKSVYLNEHQRLMRVLTDKAVATIAGVVDAVLTALVVVESNAGILFVLSGGKNADQIEGVTVFWFIFLTLVAMFVGFAVLGALIILGEHHQVTKLKARRRQARRTGNVRVLTEDDRRNQAQNSRANGNGRSGNGSQAVG